MSTDFVHEAVVVGSDAELVSAVLDAAEGAHASGHVFGISCRPSTWSLVRPALRGTAVSALPESGSFRRPAQTLATYRSFIESALAAGAPGVLLAGEAPVNAPRHRLLQWERFESVTNAVLGAYPYHAVCLYDARALPADVVAGVGRTHGRVRRAGTVQQTDDFVDPRTYLATADPVTSRLPRRPPDLDEDVSHAGALRRRVRGTLLSAGLPARPTAEFVLALSEVVTNAFVHGRAPVHVRMWVGDGRLVATVVDAGDGITDSLLGYAPVGPDLREGGMGLWIARQLCDDVTWTPTPEGFTIRLETILDG